MIYFPRRSPQLLNFAQVVSTHNPVISGGALTSLTLNAVRPRGPGPSELLINNAGMTLHLDSMWNCVASLGTISVIVQVSGHHGATHHLQTFRSNWMS